MVIGHIQRFPRRGLARAGRVCKLWRSIVQPILYNSVYLDLGVLLQVEQEALTSGQLSFHGRSQLQLYRLLCQDAINRLFIRNLFVERFCTFDLMCLLTGCNALTALHLRCNDPDHKGPTWESGLSILESVGPTLQQLSLSDWWTVNAAAWAELLEPLECVKQLTLDSVLDFKQMQSAPLKLHGTVTSLTVEADEQDDSVSGEGVSEFLGAFTNLEHLIFSVELDEMQLPVQALPPTLHTLELADSDPTGYLEILLRLASPDWLPNLRRAPKLRVTGLMEDTVEQTWEELGDEAWPSHAEVERLMKEAVIGLKQRQGWEGGDGKAAFWPDLLKLFDFDVAPQDGDPL